MTDRGTDPRGNGASAPRKDPLEESKRLVGNATNAGLTMRVLGGVAVCLQAPDERPLLARKIGDIDVTTKRDGKRTATDVLMKAGYIPDEMFNALHGTRRLLFYDEVNQRKLDVFIGDFSMCHEIPISDRLELEPLTVPLAELMLTKLQIVELTERDQRDIYNLAYHHELSYGDSKGIELDFIASLCARDWGLWRTTKATIERCVANVAGYDMPGEATITIVDRLKTMWRRIEEAPKSTRWRMRSRLGDRVKWYEEPEEQTAAP
jgi:hypothetical protein